RPSRFGNDALDTFRAAATRRRKAKNRRCIRRALFPMKPADSPPFRLFELRRQRAKQTSGRQAGGACVSWFSLIRFVTTFTAWNRFVAQRLARPRTRSF